MLQRWAGPIVVVLILGGVIAVLVLNLNVRARNTAELVLAKREPAHTDQLPPATKPPVPVVRQPARFREYPIGDEFQKNEMLIKAVWLPPVQMEGMEGPTSANLIHLEADIHATEGNRNGFAKDEFVPYLVIHYTIVPIDSQTDDKNVALFNGKLKPIAARDGLNYGATIEGKLMPMVARDGLHYGATIEMRGPGRYKLTYAIEPPSAGGLGRHVDPATGVEPWWKPFEVSFAWEFNQKGE
jgi:periplasmic iron binding protein